MTLFPEPFTNLCNFWKKQKTAVVGRQFFKNNEKMRKILKQVCVLLATALLGVSVSCGQFDVGDFQTSFGEFTEEDVISISNSDISVHFLQLGNQFTGDCTLIKTGDQEILIDAGSRKGSAETIVPYIEQFCEDGVLEYVVATHAHQDHIAGFVGTEKAKGVFEVSFAKPLSIIRKQTRPRKFVVNTRRCAIKKWRKALCIIRRWNV